jgi:hypothetical protein
MRFYDWIFPRRTKPGPLASEPRLVETEAAEGRPARRVLLFDDMDEMLRWAEETEARDPSEAEEPGIRRPQLYMFQHAVLPDAAFRRHPDLLHALVGERVKSALTHCWALAAVRAVNAGLMTQEQVDAEVEADDSPWTLIEHLRITTYAKGGCTVHVVTMPEPESVPECHFVAIVFEDGEPKRPGNGAPSTRYFTLEQTQGAGPPVLCEWIHDGSRANYGACAALEPDRFAQAVHEKLTQDGHLPS